jgi:hypothetical protein
VNLLILVVDDEPDVEALFRQQFRHPFAKKSFKGRSTASTRRRSVLGGFH